MEVQNETEGKMQFLVNGVKLCFSLSEFACATGLKYTSDIKSLTFSNGKKNRLIKKYFVDYSSLVKKYLSNCFLNKTFESDEDDVNAVMLYVINFFLFSTKNTK